MTQKKTCSDAIVYYVGAWMMLNIPESELTPTVIMKVWKIVKFLGDFSLLIVFRWLLLSWTVEAWLGSQWRPWWTSTLCWCRSPPSTVDVDLMMSRSIVMSRLLSMSMLILVFMSMDLNLMSSCTWNVSHSNTSRRRESSRWWTGSRRSTATPPPGSSSTPSRATSTWRAPGSPTQPGN